LTCGRPWPVGVDSPLVRASLLGSLAPGSREFVLQRSTVRRLAGGEHLFHHGDAADCMYVVESGRFAVKATTSDGDTAIVRIIGPEQVVGELALLVDGLRRTGTVVALEPSVVRVVSRSLFSDVRARDPLVDRALVEDLAGRLAELSEQFVVSQFGSLAERVAERLLVLDGVYRHGWIEVTQESLGAMTGGSRQAVNRILADAAAEGLIAIRRGAVRVLDPAALAARSR
jgi:CRP/FNR family cyclic AMP-dependent transcriptional regulator